MAKQSVTESIKKYTGHDVDETALARRAKDGNPIARMLIHNLSELERAEWEMRDAHRKLQEDLDRIKAVLDAGPDDRVYAVEGPAYMNVNPARMESAISLRGARVREVQMLVHHYRAEHGDA